MKVTLKVKDRLIVMAAFPKEGDLTQVRLIREAQQALEFEEAEVQALELKTDEKGNMQWKADADSGRTFEFGTTVAVTILESFEKLGEQRKLPVIWLDTYELLRKAAA